mgnify:CR=1 FL=1
MFVIVGVVVELWDVWWWECRCLFCVVFFFFFFQAEDGIRDAQESRGLGDVYKRQLRFHIKWSPSDSVGYIEFWVNGTRQSFDDGTQRLSLIHI